MTDATNVFAERYRNKSTRNLARLAIEENNLVPQAREALRAEIARRPEPADGAQAHADAPIAAEESLDGVRGWLLLYCLNSIYASIRMFLYVFSMNDYAEIPLELILFFFAVAGLYLAIGLAIFFRSQAAFKMVLIQLILGAVAIVVLLAVRIASPEPADDAMKIFILESIFNGVLIVVWYRYFRVSRRVRLTFGRNL